MKRYTDSEKLLIIKDYYDHKNSYYYGTLEKTAMNYGISKITIGNGMKKFGNEEITIVDNYTRTRSKNKENK